MAFSAIDPFEKSFSGLSLNEEDGFISFDDVAIIHEIGKGNFGRVMKADYNGTDVAVKEVTLHSAYHTAVSAPFDIKHTKVPGR